MSKTWESLLQVDLPTEGERAQLLRLAGWRNWPLALMLVGWLHLLAFGSCYYLTVGADYHEAPGYLAVWVGELVGLGLIFRLCARPRPTTPPPLPPDPPIPPVGL